MTSVLVGFATAHGSTREIAERIAAELEEQGVEADARPLASVERPEDYDAFVIGSAVHNMAWLPEALDFTHTHRSLLTSRPLWLFSVGMPAALRGPMRALVTKEETKIAGELREILRPRGHRLFSGVIAPDHLPPTGRVKLKAMGLRYGDYRDWRAIDAWTREIGQQLSDAGHSGR